MAALKHCVEWLEWAGIESVKTFEVRQNCPQGNKNVENKELKG